jgi:hypothetical protein
MSTTNPDDTRREISKRFVIPAIVVSVLGFLSAPVFTAINLTAANPDNDTLVVFMLVYIVLVLVGGLLAYYSPGARPPLGIAAFTAAYVAGLLMIMSTSVPLADPTSIIHQGFWFVAIPTITAIVLTVLYVMRVRAVAVTTATGIDTTGTVESAGIDGMVNYVTHQRLTISFVDNKGVKRYLRIGRTGGGYGPGDTVPLRYDPARPWSKRSIIVGH